MLSVSEARRHCVLGADHIIWRDHKGRCVGIARVTWQDESSLTVEHDVEDLGYAWANRGTTTITIQFGGGLAVKRAFAECPDCGEHAVVLILGSGWCCARCSELPNRSALISKEVRWFEEYTDLRVELSARENHPNKRRIGKRLARLHAKLGDRTPVANSLFAPRLKPHWTDGTSARRAFRE